MSFGAIPIRCHIPARLTVALAMLALVSCSPAGTMPTVFDAAEPGTTAPVITPASLTSASGGAQIMDGFIVDTGPPQPVDPRGRYYIDFRSRWLSIYGHTYVVYGRLDGTGRPIDQHFVALYPEGGYFGLTVGSLPLMVPATTLPTAEDRDFDTLAVYRRPIDAAQYEKIQAFVYQTRSHANAWNLYTVNCNYFAGEIAALIGLNVPPLSAQLAPLYVKELELLNPS